MFGKRNISLIIKKVFEEAELTVNTFAFFSTKNNVAAVYTALIAYFLVGYKAENELARSLIPAFKGKIRRSVSETEFSECSDIISEAYIRFSGRGITHSYKGMEWQDDSFEDYADIIIELIGARSTEINKNHILETIYRLFKIVSKECSEEGLPEKPTFKVAIAQLAVFCVLYILVFQFKNLYVSFIEGVADSLNSESLDMLLFLGYYIGLPLVIAFCVSKVHNYIFRSYMISVFTGIMMFLVVSISFVIDVAPIYISHRYDRGGEIFTELWFFANMTAGFIYFYHLRLDRS